MDCGKDLGHALACAETCVDEAVRIDAQIRESRQALTVNRSLRPMLAVLLAGLALLAFVPGRSGPARSWILLTVGLLFSITALYYIYQTRRR